MQMTPEQVEFLKKNRYAIVAAHRKDGRTHQSLIIYGVEGDDTIFFSSGGDRVKLKLLRRDPRVSFCIVSEEAYMKYLTVYGTVEFVEDMESVVDYMSKVHTQLRGQPISDEERAGIVKKAEEEGRVIVRVKIDDALPWHAPRTRIEIRERAQ